MKARLAKKLAQTSLDRLAPYWINKFVCTDGRDARFKKSNRQVEEERTENIMY